MTADLMPFAYEGAQLRTIVIDGEPWFVAADVARLLPCPLPPGRSRSASGSAAGTPSAAGTRSGR